MFFYFPFHFFPLKFTPFLGGFLKFIKKKQKKSPPNNFEIYLKKKRKN
jgi:hypothetical protein